MQAHTFCDMLYKQNAGVGEVRMHSHHYAITCMLRAHLTKTCRSELLLPRLTARVTSVAAPAKLLATAVATAAA